MGVHPDGVHIPAKTCAGNGGRLVHSVSSAVVLIALTPNPERHCGSSKSPQLPDMLTSGSKVSVPLPVVSEKPRLK